ncbi:aminotransferase class IV [Aequorivita sp. H23M31]|uniref:branched-chain-amino-acid transaminase n=1 Tax=Aequorivita ciconiae TaxID=2494375 RepID=A0A410G0L1_9FLAO|nr:aminotransferase class IV [Aequorivita sp. H23M31]QAA80803.1 aminotransferase class IV [Aequorivita sp. H23M31]
MVNINGNLFPESALTLALNNRGLNYGDAVFETIRTLNGKIFFWEDHYFRMMSSMRILRMEIPMNFTMEFLESEILRTLETSVEKNSSFRVKILVWRKEGGKYTPASREIEYAISLEKLDHPFYILKDSACEVELFKDYFISSGLLSTIKSNNRLINILGSIYAEENAYDNCFLLNEHKQIVEALNGNVFLVSGNTVKTPPLSDGCLNGIMRKQLIAIMNTLPEFVMVEESISPFELQKADEIYITNVISGIVPITKYRKKEYGNDLGKILLPKINLRAGMN